MMLTPDGIASAAVLDELEGLRGADVRWREGRAFTLVYHAGGEVLDLARRAYAAYSSENGLNTDAFPSLRRMQADVVDTVTGWLHGPAGAAGFMTSGGTESILMAVLAARERGRRERGIEAPEMVLPTSAHAAFEKAAHYFGVRSVRVPVGADWRADGAAMRAAVNDRTVLVVGSAPQYPQGVVDPIAEIAAMAAERDVLCHVDACMGGVLLPYLERLGHAVAPFDFRVGGVTSMSVDLHKFGYTAKGASVIVYRTRQLRAYQTFTTDNWLGGLYGSSGVLGTKSGGSVAAAWAVMRHLGDAGYLALAASARRAAAALATAIDAHPALALRAWPDAAVLSFGAADPATLDVFAVAERLWQDDGWYLDRQGPPASLHCTVNAVHDGLIDTFTRALDAAVAVADGTVTQGTEVNVSRVGRYGTVE
jgi:sphinganine-1-phosphate aldolase